jgi:hypothetical protein
MKTMEINQFLAQRFGILLMLSATSAPTSAEIIYGMPQQGLYYHTAVDVSYDVDVRGTTPDFTLISRSFPGTAGIAPVGDNKLLTTTGPSGLDQYSWIAALSEGSAIGSSLEPAFSWYDRNTDQYGQGIIGLGPDGAGESYFLNQTPPYSGFTAYAGFDLVYDGANHYGWIRISDPYPPIFTAGEILDWAYETSPNTPILAGAVPEPRSVGLFELGVVLLAWRVGFRQTRHPLLAAWRHSTSA